MSKKQLDPPALHYAPSEDIYDEMAGPDRLPRPHWQRLSAGLRAIGPSGMRRRWDRGQRLLRANGVTYNVYGDPEGTERPWRLDPVPMLISADDWRHIDQALSQRALLLNMILDDLYGPQRLLRQGLLPPAVVHANPAFLRALVGAIHDGPRLHLYGADIARSPDGLWWVVGDRSEAPSGAGYALENRSIISRVLPDLYRSCDVARLAPWFGKLRESLIRRALLNRDEPNIVLLTPGPYNETWFEHTYLARTLGLTLVEGEDLTVRDGRVNLKTTDGLKPVDVILRRTDGAYCDPLELRSDSTLGVPGLVQAIHGRTVALCNGLGSGLVESPALMAFLPTLCRAMLGQDLLMPSVATWWCGQRRELEYVVQNLDRLALRPAFSASVPLVRGALLSAAEKEQWIARLRANPIGWVAQEAVDLSTAPLWRSEGITPCPVVVRTYACAEGDSYAVMPGGLTRTGTAPRELSVSMQHGGGSKDTWILTDADSAVLQPSAVPVVDGLQGIEPRLPLARGDALVERPVSPQLQRGKSDLPSRMADNMFWLGRYLERCEDTCRLLRAVLFRVLAGPDAAHELTVALALFQRMAHLPLSLDLSGTGDPHDANALSTTHERALRRLLRVNMDSSMPHALAGTIQNLSRVATVVKDHLSHDTWRTLISLPGRMTSIGPPHRLDPDDAATALDRLIMALSALAGLAQESMTRGSGWRFMDMGRRIERSLHCLDLLDATQLDVDSPLQAALELALDVSDSQMTYRSRYLAAPRFLPTLDLLLADETNPRSLAFQIARLMEHMEALVPHRNTPVFTAEHRLVISLQATVRTVSLDRVLLRGQDGVTLSALTATLRDDLYRLVDALSRRYFVHAAEQRQPHRIALLRPLPSRQNTAADDEDEADGGAVPGLASVSGEP